MNKRDKRSDQDRALIKSLGEAFQIMRADAGLTQREAAQRGDTTQARVSYLEIGDRDVLVGTLNRMANAYGYTIEFNFVPTEDIEAANDACDS